MSLSKKIGIAFLISMITGWFSVFLWTKQAQGRFIQWQSLGGPPNKVTKITGATIGSVTVETTSGENYVCYLSTVNECWEVAAEPARTENTDCTPPKDLPRPLTQIVDVRRICILTLEGQTESDYALRDDGDVYVWHGNRGFGEGAGVVYLLSLIAGVLVGLIGTFFFFFVSWLVKLK